MQPPTKPQPTHDEVIATALRLITTIKKLMVGNLNLTRLDVMRLSMLELCFMQPLTEEERKENVRDLVKFRNKYFNKKGQIRSTYKTFSGL